MATNSPNRTVRSIAIVGGGLGGLSAAAHLVSSGHKITIFETDSHLGGKSSQFTSGGYTIDAGPSVLTMLPIIDTIFAALGEKTSEHLDLVKLDTLYKANFASGNDPYGEGSLSVRANHDDMVAEIRSVAGAKDADAFVRFSKYLKDLYDAEFNQFIDRNFDSLFDFLAPISPTLKLLKLGAFKKLNSIVSSYFSDERLVKLFSFQSLYAGVSPFEALGIYAVITYMDTIAGVYFPKGGMAQLPIAIGKVLADKGVAIRTKTKVTSILRSNGMSGSVTGVQLEDGSRESFDVVISNAEAAITYKQLLGQSSPPRKIARSEYSPSALLMLMGTKSRPTAEVAHHNIFFGDSWKDAFVELIDEGRQMTNASTLVTIPSFSDPQLAKDNGAALYCLEPVPNLGGKIDWKNQRQNAVENFKASLRSAKILSDDPSDIEVEKIIDPLDWKAMGMEMGTPFSISHRFFQSGPFRPANNDKRVPGLFFASASTTPGVGVPMVLVSGRLAAERVRTYLGDR
ncbi:MAG: phytoene desaturase family protein [Actinomycetota bacterium]|nr:phytoene desaturase family protein [Actinomycetota bacterium]